MNDYVVAGVRAGPRHRLVTVVDRLTREPVYFPSLYSMVVLRRGARSHSTARQGLQGVAKLETFISVRGIPFVERVASREFMTDDEKEDFVGFLRGGAYRTSLENGMRGGGHVRLSNARTVALRLAQATKFLDWQFRLVCRRVWPMEERDAALEEAQEFLLDLSQRGSGLYAEGSDRIGLTPSQLAALFAVLHRLADAVCVADEPAAFRMDRILLWFEYLVEFGLRIGELLGIRLRDFDSDEGSIWIVRRPDAEDDTRDDDARVKGYTRKLPMSPYLARRTREHAAGFRAFRPHAGGNDFLFVSTQGEPLSRSSVNRMFEFLRTEQAALDPHFTCHVMRHTWNDAFSDDAIAEGLTEAETSDIRAYFMGWRNPRSERPYLRGRRQRHAKAIGLRCQERLLSLLGRAGHG